ncbi:substrate-binding domain-containing protein [uncultured Enterovirga sp.]|uniref:substrate-binding domain-containing protein n=1 Tax=uncultured Enterovirga sp. TaxID=2026352 RepID=UPI0035CB9881
MRRFVLAATSAALCILSTAALAQKRIAMVQAHQESRFRIDLNTGAHDEAKRLGARLVIYNANNNPGLQTDAIETYINDKVDIILVLAIDANGIKPAIEEAVKAGIPVLAVDTVVSGANLANIGVDNKDAGREIGRRVGEYLASAGGPQDVGIVGALNSYIQNLRLDGFKEGLAAANPKARIVGTVDGQNVQNVAQNAAEGLLTAHANLGAVYATGEPALVGVLAASRARAGGKFKVFGWDLNSQAIKAIDDGLVGTIVQQEAYKLGATAVATAIDHLGGKKIPPVVAVPVSFVDKSNVDGFRARFK